ncbi:MAG: DUF4124 domain-containing protein [Gammaproteobacteria bacterium]|nr:DUF4124 domain-containing protein [Gammaproteobacteria bacterium]
MMPRQWPKQLTSLAVAIVAGLGLAGAGEVYKEVDEQGNVVYSDRPRDASAPRLDIDSSKTDPEALAKKREVLEKRQEERKQAKVNAAAEAERQRDLAAQRKANCEKARSYQQRVDTARRLYDTDENGNRNYYSSEQQDAARALARDQVKEWCDTDRS